MLKYKIISQYHPESDRAWFATCDCNYYNYDNAKQGSVGEGVFLPADVLMDCHPPEED